MHSFSVRSSCPNSLVGLLEANKYKMLMRIPLDDLEVMKGKQKETAKFFNTIILKNATKKKKKKIK